MSWNPLLDASIPIGNQVDAIEALIIPRARDLGGFEVRRALPSAQRQMVGPFIFFDQMGPAEFLTGKGVDVRPHPHIGLSTVTYLMQGRMHHRDSLGNAAACLGGICIGVEHHRAHLRRHLDQRLGERHGAWLGQSRLGKETP